MSTILIAESGSTKTDWSLIKKGGRTTNYTTGGINPYLQTDEQILDLLDQELNWPKKKAMPDKVMFYGAGAGTPEKQKELKKILKQYFKDSKIDVYGDMMGAARGLCGSEKGIVCILGTGSNSCYYDGKKIKDRKASLGFIAGDEGSGNHLGKRVLRYYAYNTFDEDIRATFEEQFGNNIPEILNNIYKKPFPNRYLASMVNVLIPHRGHFMVENIIEDSFNEFFHHHILKYRESWKMPIYFCGSVAYQFKDVLQHMCDQCELTIGHIEKSPLKGLIKFHKAELENE